MNQKNEIGLPEIEKIKKISALSMKESINTLSMLLNQPITLSDPETSVIDKSHAVNKHKEKYVMVNIRYTSGAEGDNFLFLKESDAKIITDFMMGSDGTGMYASCDFSELHSSAVSEAMNQMMGTTATVMSDFLKNKVDISTPDVRIMVPDSIEDIFHDGYEIYVKVKYKVQIKDLKITMLQFFNIPFIKNLSIQE